ncbi:hypothetical protein EV691_1634 [Azotobacter chroococcum]|uniref:Uncharacterized protein n=1 Tax=Azotobacter chroococcum TaxID=353 RepID=A0A4V2Q4J9_9GAMM|nr:hypothetical protein EV691_1634 [Azotobacter chroococcum]
MPAIKLAINKIISLYCFAISKNWFMFDKAG